MIGPEKSRLNELHRDIKFTEAELDAGSALGNFFRRRDIARMKEQVDQVTRNLNDWQLKVNDLYANSITGIKPGEAVIIGREGDIPVFNSHLAEQHAQIECLEDGRLYAIRDCIPGESSKPGGHDYGTFVKRVGEDGKEFWEPVGPNKPTILYPGDEIRLGFRTDNSDLEDPSNWNFIIPGTKSVDP